MAFWDARASRFAMIYHLEFSSKSSFHMFFVLALLNCC